MRRTSVAAVVIIALVAVVTALLATLGALYYVSYREKGKARLRRVLSTHAEQLAVGLALPVWNIDRSQIDRIVESQESDREIYAIVVQSAGRTQAQARDDRWQLIPADGRLAEPGLLREERPIVLSGDALGSVTLYGTPRFIEQDLRTTLASIGATILAVDVLLVFGIYLVLRRTVLEPLRNVERYALAVKSGGGGEAASLRAGGFVGELESLRASIEAMVQLLDVRYAELREEMERRQASDEAVRASEKKYRDIVDFSPVGIFQTTIDGRLITANLALARLLGYDSVDEVLTLNVGRDIYYDPTERSRLLAQYAGAGYGNDVEVLLKRGDGAPLWASITGHVIKDAEGKILHIESFVRDISMRKKAEAALKDSEERYRLLFEGNPVPMLIYDLETLSVLAANEAAVLQYRHSREELLQLSVPDLAVPEDEQLAAFLATRFDPRPDLVHVGARRQRRKDGTTLEVDLTSLALRFGGRPARLLLARDLTAEKQDEAERDRLHAALQHSEKMSAMGSLVAGVAHEVRNPLFSISATVDGLESDLGGEQEYREYLDLLRSQVGRLTRLMRDLLDYGKAPVLRPVAIRPTDVLRRATRSCAPLARTHGVTLTEDVAPDLPSLALDAARMEQVFENLVANAIQHSPRGSHVRIVGRLAAASEAAIEFSVEDEGPGVAPADIPRLFEPFFSRRPEGTGLGLPIAQRIVEAHGGSVVAANRPSGGAVFTVRLPLVLAERTEARSG